MLRDRWGNLRDRFGPSKHLKKTLGTTTSYSHAAPLKISAGCCEFKSQMPGVGEFNSRRLLIEENYCCFQANHLGSRTTSPAI